MDLLSIIYSAVKVLGIFAVIVLIISYVSFKFRTRNDLKPHETEVDTTNELKMTVKDTKTNKETVKGSISKRTPSKSSEIEEKRKPTSSSSKDKISSSGSSRHSSSGSSSHYQKSKDNQKDDSRSSSSRKSSGSSSKNRQEYKISKPKKRIPNRDSRIKILNKLNHTQDESSRIEVKQSTPSKNKTTIESDFKKFYDATQIDD